MTTIPGSIAAWLSSERGLSSNFMVQHLFGLTLNSVHWRGPYHPYDPGDLTRCQRLIEASPEVAGRFGEMATASPEWAALVPVWGELVGLLDEEAPEWREKTWGSAPRCYARMREVLREARK